MTGMFKTLALASVVSAIGFAAQPAKADHVSVGFGVSVPVIRTVAPVYQPAYVPAPVVTYAAPAYSYTSSYSYTPAYCPPAVVYSPAPVYYTPAPTVVYSAPVYASPVYTPVYSSVYDPYYYGSSGFSFNIGFGGHDRDYRGGYNGGGNHGGGDHGGGHRR